jgi:hypothetical protein
MRAVSCYGWRAGGCSRRYLAATDVAGRYGFELVPGRYYIRAEETGNVFTYYPVSPLNVMRMPVTASDTPLENINIALPLSSSGVHVTGRVKFPAGQQRPSLNQTVQLNGSYRLNGPIAEDGTFDIPHMRRGNYQITVTAAPGAAPAAISAGNADVGGIELTVPRLVPVAGSVSAENGVTPLRLTIGIDSLNYRTNVTLLGDGTFRTELPEGRYHFGLSLPAGYYLKSMESGKTDLQTDFLQISSNDSAVAVKIALGASPGIRVTGHVKVSGPGSSSSSMKMLTLQGRATNETAEANIASDGSFELTKVVPGIYTARVTLASRLTSPALSP